MARLRISNTLNNPLFRLVVAGIVGLIALIMEADALSRNDIAMSIGLNSLLTLIIYDTIYVQILSKQKSQSMTKIPVYELQRLHRYAEFGKLTSGFIHDLANPLTAVTLDLEILRRKKRSAQIERAINGTQLMSLYVKAARNQLSGENIHQVFIIRQILRNIEYMTSYRARKQNVTINIRCDERISYEGNPIRLQQALCNIISNAIDSYDGLECDARIVRVIVIERLQFLEINILDEGVGIPIGSHAKIFEPFYTTKTLLNSTGIGLVITKDIVVNEFHGKIAVTSKPGKGSTFHLTLPKKREKIFT